MSEDERELVGMLLAAVVLLSDERFNRQFEQDLMNAAKNAGFIDSNGRSLIAIPRASIVSTEAEGG